MNKAFSQACENNKRAISQELVRIFSHKSHALEIGSGTGQHGVYFAKTLPHLTWQLSDRHENHVAILQWQKEYPSKNLLPPIALDVMLDPWPEPIYDAAFSANTAHIMPWEAVVAMFLGVSNILKPQGTFCLYGPMKYQGVLEAQSNVAFDAALREAIPHQGIRDFEDINALAKLVGLMLLEDKQMPANNRLLVWQKSDVL